MRGRNDCPSARRDCQPSVSETGKPVLQHTFVIATVEWQNGGGHSGSITGPAPRRI